MKEVMGWFRWYWHGTRRGVTEVDKKQHLKSDQKSEHPVNCFCPTSSLSARCRIKPNNWLLYLINPAPKLSVTWAGLVGCVSPGLRTGKTPPTERRFPGVRLSVSQPTQARPLPRPVFPPASWKSNSGVNLNGSLWALPIFTITARPSGNVITQRISRTAHILKCCVFWCAADHFQMQQIEFSWAKVARNQASPQRTQLSESFYALMRFGGNLWDMRCF